MGENGIPRPARIAALLTFLLAPAGLLLLADGILETHWWHTPGADRLAAVFRAVDTQFGIDRPVLLRGSGGAVELMILGLACLACAAAARMVLRGRRWTRNLALVLAIATFLLGLIDIGIDSAPVQDLAGYYQTLDNVGAGGFLPEIRSLMYPGWYQWLEDSVQGVQVLVSLAAMVALAGTAVWCADYFVSKRAETAAPTAWDEAISRIRAQNASKARRD